MKQRKQMLSALSVLLLLTACASKPKKEEVKQKQVTVQTETKKKVEQVVEQDKTKATVKQTEVKKDNTTIKLEATKSSYDVTGTIVNYYLHGDHWHVELSNGKTMITYKDPRTIFPAEAFVGNSSTTSTTNPTVINLFPTNTERKLVSYYQHGDHWHLVYSDGTEEVSYEKPGQTNVVETAAPVVDHTTDNSTNTSNGLFEKVIEHGDHVHVWVRGVEYSIAKELYEEFVANNTFDEVKARGQFGLYYKDIQDPQLKEQVEYIARGYGVKLEAIRVSEEFFSFNDPSHEFDPTHIHPYFIARSRFYIPISTGIPEIDFENELMSLSYRTGIPSSKLMVQDGRFVLSHDDHDHYVYIQSSGYEDYINNKKPVLSGPYIPGDLNEQTVRNKLELLKAQTEIKYQSRVEQRRVMRVLEEFEQQFDTLKTNSTEGYLAILAKFENLYILEKQDVVVDKTDSELDAIYQALLDKIAGKGNSFYSNLYLNRDQFVSKVNQAYNDRAKLYQYNYMFKEYDRFDGRVALVGIGYVKYFMEQLNTNKVEPALANKIAGLLIEVTDKDFFSMNNNVEQFVDLNIQLQKSYRLGQEYQLNASELVNYNKLMNWNYKQRIENFVAGVEHMLFPIELPDASQLPQD